MGDRSYRGDHPAGRDWSRPGQRDVRDNRRYEGDEHRSFGERGRFDSDEARYGGPGRGERRGWPRDRYGADYGPEARAASAYRWSDYDQGDYGDSYGRGAEEHGAYGGQDANIYASGGDLGRYEPRWRRADRPYGYYQAREPVGRRHDHRPHADDDFDHNYLNWRDEQLRGHDRDYHDWRRAQHEQYDTDYRSFRQERQQTFGKSFQDWRAENRKGPLDVEPDQVRSVTDGKTRPDKH